MPGQPHREKAKGTTGQGGHPWKQCGPEGTRMGTQRKCGLQKHGNYCRRWESTDKSRILYIVFGGQHLQHSRTRDASSVQLDSAQPAFTLWLRKGSRHFRQNPGAQHWGEMPLLPGQPFSEPRGLKGNRGAGKPGENRTFGRGSEDAWAAEIHRRGWFQALRSPDSQLGRV